MQIFPAGTLQSPVPVVFMVKTFAVYLKPKIFLFFYPYLENSTTGIATMLAIKSLHFYVDVHTTYTKGQTKKRYLY